MSIFADNVRYISLLNKIDGKASYGITAFSDLTTEEFAQKHLGFVPTVEGEYCQEPSDAQIASIPDSVDWRKEGALSPVQDQGSCGSCWAFATVAAVESAWYIAKGDLIKLSEQQLVDCDSNQGGCDGGNMYPAEGYVQKNGLTTEEAYPYKGVQGKCKSFNPVVTIRDHCFIKQRSTDAETEDVMRYHLAQGPVVIGINANKAQFYTGGVMDEKNCNPKGVNHAVVAVGYNVSASEPYWIIRNSWSDSWGEEGYFRMIYGKNACGIATSASYVVA